MASVVTEAGGRRLIQLSPGEHPGRPKIRLGKVSKREAASALVHVEALCRAKRTGASYPAAAAEWLAGLPESVRRRLERFGLVEPPEPPDCPTLADWVTRYIEGRRDVKESTRTKYRQAEGKLLAFFGAGRRLDEITPGDADEFRIYLKAEAGCAEETIRSRLACAKLFLGAAVRKRVLVANPFDGQPTASRGNPKREYFVTLEEAAAVLAAIPDVGYRLVFALARYGGLRSPTEVQTLKWADVQWAQQRFTVHAAKTEHHADAGIRVVPIFDELYPHLLAAFEAAEDGAIYCCPQHGRNAGQVYPKHILRAIAQAGLKPWPKLFQNLRSTRETELAEQFPVHVVCEWIGNSPRVAAKHYLQVTEDHFARAVQKTVQNPVQQASAPGRTESREGQTVVETANVCGPAQENAAPCDDREPHSVEQVCLAAKPSLIPARR